jgi:ADP-heptose:LPS heptosyltransferase
LANKAKTAIVTVVSGEKYAKIWAKTRPSFEAYADRIGTELIVMGYHDGLPSQHWVKLGLYELLKKRFDRVAYLDADILIREDCPSLFDVVPADALGIFNEGKYTPRAVCIYEIMNAYKIALPKWDRIAYYNTGVMVISRAKRHIFKPPQEVRLIRNSYGEQTWLNLQIIQKEVKVHELSHTFNHMSIMDRLTGVSRKAAYIIHYAGPPSEETLFTALEADLQAWSRREYAHKPNLFINIGGGLGDQVCAEPVLRYIRGTLYPDAEIYAATAYPRLFQHIEGVHIDSKMPDVKLEAVHSMDTHPDKNTAHSQYVVYSHSHQVDYISLVTLKRTLPVEDKEIKLTWNPEDEDEVFNLCPCPGKLVLVHAGKGWPSKTFPVEWWQEIVNGLALDDYQVGLIGGTVNEEHAYQPVELPAGGFDFRDKLSLGGLIYLLRSAPVLITNDSGPLHLAGAFHNQIILIPSCKHPDYVLPIRKGSTQYRTNVLYRKLVCEARPYRPTDVEAWNPKDVEGDILDYLPEPMEVIEAVKQCNWVNMFIGLTPDQPTTERRAENE